jgi:hypothetical protein
MFKRTQPLHVQVTTLAFTLILLAARSVTAIAQSQPETATSGAPVAFVYVTSAPGNGIFEINAYAASSNGSLRKISGSPFPSKGSFMAVNGKWLFDTDGVNIFAFAIQRNGALREGPEVNTEAHNQVPNVGGPLNLVLDHTGQSLYDGDILIDGSNNGYQSFKIINATGQLEFQQDIPPFNIVVDFPLSFSANNEFAYGSSCVKGIPFIYGYKRNSDGTLQSLNLNPNIPPSLIAGSENCPFLAAADTSNHVAVSLTPFAPFFDTGPPQIAVYTADDTGTLTTTSTAANMPRTSVVSVIALSMAPSGKLLAVGGAAGLQVFHFNGANPVTFYTGLLTHNEIDQMFWDKANHLYAISQKAGKLYVFTITPTAVIRAPGSPHNIANPQNIAVLPKR